MQSLLYLSEEADTQNRQGKLGPALKKYLAIQKVALLILYRYCVYELSIQVFGEYIDDQYDFHFYSIRRSTINAYLK